MSSSLLTQQVKDHRHSISWSFFSAITIVFLGASFYIYEYFLRVMPSVLVPELSSSFAIDAQAVGYLSVSFFHTYALMQIPAGLLCDRYGPKKCLQFAVMVCAVCTFLFQWSTSYWVALLCRLLIGAVSAFAFVCPLKLASSWFSGQRQALITGLIQVMGCMGAVLAGAPLAYAIDIYGWRVVHYYAASLGVVLFVLYTWVIKNTPMDGQHEHVLDKKIDASMTMLARFKKVCLNRQSWFIGLTAFAVWSPVAVFAETWGVSYLQVTSGVSKVQAASQIGMVWIGMAIASPVAGWLSNVLSLRKMPTLILMLTGCIAASMLVFAPPKNELLICLWLLLIGISSAGQPITFGMVHDINDEDTLATAISLNNMLLIVSCSILPPVVATLLNGGSQKDILSLAPSVFQYAHSIVPVVIFVGMLGCFFFVQETHCKRQL